MSLVNTLAHTLINTLAYTLKKSLTQKTILLSSVFISLLTTALTPFNATAKGDLTKQTPIEIKVILGDIR
ncbi:MAG: hypothetical protein JKX76_07670 [Colwellia sp.]|nr:hypothetical protein [Colwellia sp.]